MRETDRDELDTETEKWGEWIERWRNRGKREETTFERLGKVKESGRRCLERRKDVKERERARQTRADRQEDKCGKMNGGEYGDNERRSGQKKQTERKGSVL